MNEKLQVAIDYLRSRNKYVADIGCAFVPTLSTSTDVAKTFQHYRQQVLTTPKMRVVRRAK